jgi:hypothetical protein
MKIQKKTLTSDTTKLLGTEVEEPSRLEKERKENEESAKNVSHAYKLEERKKQGSKLD